MSSQSSLTTIFLFLIFPSLTYSYDFYSCGSNGNYTSNSTYRANLNTLFSSLSTNINEYGFFNASVVHDPDYLNVIMLCRGDVQLEKCRDCAQNATVDITRICPNQKEAILWGSFCMLSYSNQHMLGTMKTNPNFPWYYLENVTSPSEFVTDLKSLLESLRVKAVYSLYKVAAGNVTSVNFQAIYALVQCTPDLSSEACSICLLEAYQRLEDCCNTSKGVYLFMPSCNLYYDAYEPFFNKTRLQELDVISVVPESAPIASPTGNGNNNTTRIIIIIGSVAASLLLAILVMFLPRKRVEERRKKFETDIPGHESRQYDFGEIRTATNDFSQANQLGEGGFGSVYQGVLPNNQTIAVKRLSRDSDQGSSEFKNEVMFLAGLQHRNLVRLLGFAQEGPEKVLVYEFLPSGSLDRFIYDPIKRSCMTWNTRSKIIWGIAKGLLYLHEDSRLNIIHRDIKPANVLLDEEMNPKIADFGTAKLFEPEKTQAHTKNIVGTRGYMAPEYVMRAEVSVKTDVFSFGVMTLEIITGEKNIPSYKGINQISGSLISNVSENWHNGIAANSIDPHLPSDSGLHHEILKFIHIALLCVETSAANRPTMASVVSILSSYNVDMPIPSKHIDYHSEVSNSKVLQERIVSYPSSIIDVTMTQFYPR